MLSPKTITSAIALLTTTAALIINISLPATAKSPEISASKPAKNLIIAQSNLSRPNYPLNVLWSLQWSVNGFVHKVVLSIDGYSGTSATTFWEPDTQRQECVLQDIEVYDSPDGLVIFGYNPRDCTTKRRYSTYAADNFIIAQDDGLKAFVVDDNGVKAAVRIENLSK